VRIGNEPEATSIVGQFLAAGQLAILSATLISILAIAVADWAVGNSVSLGVLYIFPMMLGALALRPIAVLTLALVCSVLRTAFDTPGSAAEVDLRFAFATAAYFCAGLFVTALVRNRQLIVQHLADLQQEQELRQGAEQQLKLMVESSSAAILTTDREGQVLAANDSANIVFGVTAPKSLLGKDIRSYLPVLADALKLEMGSQVFKTAVQCQARRENGELFLAQTWFSTYTVPQGPRLAAIVGDSSEEMKDREEQNLRELLEYNRITAAALSHEVRNACAALKILAEHLDEKQQLSSDGDFQALVTLVNGLESMAAISLKARAEGSLDRTPLNTLLNNLQIIVDAEWRDIGGITYWPNNAEGLNVFADPHGLLQALLNLAQNSLHAVRESAMKELHISVQATDGRALIRVMDSGVGISAPNQLFRPFHPGTDGTGLGLYISRAMVRSFGGELRYEPASEGTCFVVELQMV